MKYLRAPALLIVPWCGLASRRTDLVEYLKSL